jgi:SAM-dependent methyltransferase
MKTYKYKNYNEYVKCQKAANIKKSANVWAIEENIKFLAEYMKPRDPRMGLCHGTRGGQEQKWFRDHLPICYVVGTEIGNTKAYDAVQWDFNIENPDWTGIFDFVYSNSFDHAYNPEKTLKVWSDQLKPNGIIILEYDRRQEHTGEISQPVNKTDPVSITLNELIKLIPEWTGMKVIDVLDMPVVTQEWRKAIVIKG